MAVQSGGCQTSTEKQSFDNNESDSEDTEG